MPPRLKKDFLKLVEKYLNGSATTEEINNIEDYYSQFSNDPDITDSLDENELSALKSTLRHKIDSKINQAQRPNAFIFRKQYLQWAAAFLLFSLLSLFVANKLIHKPITLQAQNHDLAPGGNKATLTLANGSKINLNNIKNGAFTAQPGAHIIKQSGQLSYKPAENNLSAINLSYNTVATPKGGQYQLILADGTKVWLNAASSLKFPTVFAGSERIVELTGEAYFEVAKNAKQPFKVKTPGLTVQDIGTQFNVNAYADEDAAATTLIEGSVKIYDTRGQTMIRPGQQYLSNTGGLSQVKTNVDVDEVTAWKSGMFQFDDADIQTIMRQIGRWYNVDIEYAGQIPASTYHGRISRNTNASTVLKILELSGINFTIERGKIIVK